MGPEFANYVNDDYLITDGIVTELDTTRILESVNIESLDHINTQPAIEARGVYNIHL